MMSCAENRESDKPLAAERGYKVYAALKYVPVALFAVFALAVFGVYALPLASYDSVNSGIAADTVGSIYTVFSGLLDIDEHVVNSVTALFVSSGIAVAYAVFSITVCATGKFGRRKTNDFTGATFAGNVCAGVYIVYILFIALGFAILGRIAAMDDGNGVLRIGPATVTMLSVAAAFIVVSAVCEAVRMRMEAASPALREAEQRVHEKSQKEATA